ncbi:MAG: glycosyltransferase [Geothrix sp.]|nr:glycosyltransferase [Geothrix sp.]
MRVLFLIHSLVAHGAERQLYELVRHMDKDRFEIHVAVFYGPGTGNQGELWSEMAALPGISLHCLHKRRGALGHLSALPRLLSLLRRVRPDVVHGYMDGNLPILLLGRILRIPVVWGIRRTSQDLTKLDRLSRQLLRVTVRLSRFADLIIFNSEAGRANHMAMGMKAPRMEVVANGFDVTRFSPDPALGAAQRDVWGVPSGAPLIGIVGRLNPVKDHSTFLRAAARLARQWPTARFICVGDGPVAYRASLMDRATSLGIGDRVQFPGNCDGMPAAYNALSILVLSSTDEGFPNVLGEAMACGIPCVTTRVGDAQVLVGPSGIVVEPGDDRAIAEALSTLMQESPQERAFRTEALRRRVCSLFSVGALARNTEQLLMRLSVSPSAVRAQTGCI